MTLLDLVARLESATEGSRELDAEIVVALNVRPDWAFGHEELWIDRKTPLPDGTPTIRLHNPRLGSRRSSGEAPIDHDYPRYTTSLDAALTLVPDVVQPCIEMTGHTDSALASVCWGPTEPFDRQSTEGAARTLPLALTIACLKARAAQEAKDADH